MGYVIGIDFDNTLVNYDDLMWNKRFQQGLISPGIGKEKNDVRDTFANCRMVKLNGKDCKPSYTARG